MTAPLRLRFDCDGVLSNFVTPALGVIRELTGRIVEPHEVTDYDLGVLLPDDELRAEFWRRTAAPGFCAALEPYPDAMLNIQELLRAGHDIEIVTAPMRDSATWKQEREAWLQEWFGVPPARIHSTHDKGTVSGDLFVDDAPKHVKAWRACNPNGYALLWDCTYNRGPETQGMTRALDWTDVFAAIESLQRGRELGRRVGTKPIPERA